MKKYVKLAIEVDKKNKKHCGSGCPWFNFSMNTCDAFDLSEPTNLTYDNKIKLYKRSGKCLRMEVKK